MWDEVEGSTYLKERLVSILLIILSSIVILLDLVTKDEVVGVAVAVARVGAAAISSSTLAVATTGGATTSLLGRLVLTTIELVLGDVGQVIQLQVIGILKISWSLGGGLALATALGNAARDDLGYVGICPEVCSLISEIGRAHV